MLWQTSLSVAECKAKLAAATLPETFWTLFRRDRVGTVYSRIGDTAFRLVSKTPLWERNAFKPLFHGKFVETADGTRIEGSFRIHSLILCFMIFWFGAVLTIGAAIIALGITSAATTQPVGGGSGSWLWALIPLTLMLLLGGGFVAWGWRLGADQRLHLTYFIEKTLQAHPVNSR